MEEKGVSRISATALKHFDNFARRLLAELPTQFTLTDVETYIIDTMSNTVSNVCFTPTPTYVDARGLITYWLDERYVLGGEGKCPNCLLCEIPFAMNCGPRDEAGDRCGIYMDDSRCDGIISWDNFGKTCKGARVR